MAYGQTVSYSKRIQDCIAIIIIIDSIFANNDKLGNRQNLHDGNFKPGKRQGFRVGPKGPDPHFFELAREKMVRESEFCPNLSGDGSKRIIKEMEMERKKEK